MTGQELSKATSPVMPSIPDPWAVERPGVRAHDSRAADPSLILTLH